MKNKYLSSLLLGGVILFSSCATNLRKDTPESVTFDPEQKGTLVYVNGEYKGKSPVTVELDPAKENNIKYVNPYYLSKSFTMNREIIKKWLWMDIFSGVATGTVVVPALIDHKNEAWLGFNEKDAPKSLKHWSEIEDPNDYLGEIFQLKNLYFETGSSDLKSESHANLDKLVAFLKQYPEAKIEVRGHTDKTGGHDLNVKLSQNRAGSVVKYLTGKGVSASRLQSQGFGPDQPLLEGDTEEVYKYNRRVEFKFVK